MPSRRREPAPAADPSPSPAAVDPELAQPTEHLPPALRTLRRSFELASLCQFVALFGPGLGIKEFDAEVSRPSSPARVVAAGVAHC